MIGLIQSIYYPKYLGVGKTGPQCYPEYLGIGSERVNKPFYGHYMFALAQAACTLGRDYHQYHPQFVAISVR